MCIHVLPGCMLVYHLCLVTTDPQDWNYMSHQVGARCQSGSCGETATSLSPISTFM